MTGERDGADSADGRWVFQEMVQQSRGADGKDGARLESDLRQVEREIARLTDAWPVAASSRRTPSSRLSASGLGQVVSAVAIQSHGP